MNCLINSSDSKFISKIASTNGNNIPQNFYSSISKHSKIKKLQTIHMLQASCLDQAGQVDWFINRDQTQNLQLVFLDYCQASSSPGHKKQKIYCSITLNAEKRDFEIVDSISHCNRDFSG